ncbi:MAG: hypothetical protein ACTSWY_11740 [Promethearchaeota archaeon]
MIIKKKKINTAFGLFLSFILIFSSIFVPLPLIENISLPIYFLILIPFITFGVTLLVLNATFLGLMRIAKIIDKNMASMGSVIYVTSMYVIVKFDEFYLVRWNDKYLHFIRIREKSPLSVSSYRAFKGPKLPSIIPLKYKTVLKYKGYKIRRSEGIVKVYDPVDEQWYGGNGVVFSIYFYIKGITPLLDQNNLTSLLYLLKSQQNS